MIPIDRNSSEKPATTLSLALNYENYDNFMGCRVCFYHNFHNHLVAQNIDERGNIAEKKQTCLSAQCYAFSSILFLIFFVPLLK